MGRRRGEKKKGLEIQGRRGEIRTVSGFCIILFLSRGVKEEGSAIAGFVCCARGRARGGVAYYLRKAVGEHHGLQGHLGLGRRVVRIAPAGGARFRGHLGQRFFLFGRRAGVLSGSGRLGSATRGRRDGVRWGTLSDDSAVEAATRTGLASQRRVAHRNRRASKSWGDATRWGGLLLKKMHFLACQRRGGAGPLVSRSSFVSSSTSFLLGGRIRFFVLTVLSCVP